MITMLKAEPQKYAHPLTKGKSTCSGKFLALELSIISEALI
jgi:hypothetical protein